MAEQAADRIENRLAGLGIVLPKAAAPVANYAPCVLTGSFSSSPASSRSGWTAPSTRITRASSAAR